MKQDQISYACKTAPCMLDGCFGETNYISALPTVSTVSWEPIYRQTVHSPQDTMKILTIKMDALFKTRLRALFVGLCRSADTI